MTAPWSFERIWENLDYYGGPPEMQDVIARTIERLPEDMVRFAVFDCVFVALGNRSETRGITLPGDVCSDPGNQATTRWLIVLDDSEEGEELQTTIAHEIAHAWRGDDVRGEARPDAEVEVARLVRGWGFTGTGADVEDKQRELEARPPTER